MCGAHGERGILRGGVRHPHESRRSLWLPRFDSGGGAVGRGKRRIRVDHSLQLRRLKEGGGRPLSLKHTHFFFLQHLHAVAAGWKEREPDRSKRFEPPPDDRQQRVDPDSFTPLTIPVVLLNLGKRFSL